MGDRGGSIVYDYPGPRKTVVMRRALVIEVKDRMERSSKRRTHVSNPPCLDIKQYMSALAVRGRYLILLRLSSPFSLLVKPFAVYCIAERVDLQ